MEEVGIILIKDFHIRYPYHCGGYLEKNDFNIKGKKDPRGRIFECDSCEKKFKVSETLSMNF